MRKKWWPDTAEEAKEIIEEIERLNQQAFEKWLAKRQKS